MFAQHPQILITELGAFQNRLVSIPLYSSSSQEQFDFIVSNGGASVIFVGDSHQYPLPTIIGNGIRMI